MNRKAQEVVGSGLHLKILDEQAKWSKAMLLIIHLVANMCANM